jgi:hypothetical protein
LLNVENVASSSKTNHDRVKALEEEVRSLRSCVKTLAKGEELHKEILYYNARDYGTKGLGAFPNPIKETPRSNTSRDVVINDVALTSLQTPEWSQLVFCDVFVTILVWSLWWRQI